MREKVTVIAEAGINHNGDLDLAKKLIDVAVFAGADAVKFQKRDIDTVYTPEQLAVPRESPWGTTTREQKEGLEFGRAEYDEIDRYCRERGIQWFASAWDLKSLEFLAPYDLPYNKVASAMVTNLPFLEAVAADGKYTFISTGMCSWEDVERAVGVFRRANCRFELMHCVSTYPCPPDRTDVACIQNLRGRFGCDVGYSGHEVSYVPTLLAVAMGASSVERHITLDRAMYGSDQAASMEPMALARLVKYIRDIPLAYGGGRVKMRDIEVQVAKKLRYWES